MGDIDVKTGVELANSGIDLTTLSAADQARLTAALSDGWRLTPATLGHKITDGRWIAARHLLHISTIIATEIAKGDARVILTMPARHGKSEFLSVNTPIWFLEKWPGKYVMTISYGSELATDFSLKVRDAFQNEDLHHLLRTRIRKDKQRVDRFLTSVNGKNAGGGLTAAGIGGPLTGRGADLMLIDDYTKNAETSLSETTRKSIWEWFKSTAYTRL
ncbi:MAG: terminase family protein [Dehalococcoidales bacterium]